MGRRVRIPELTDEEKGEIIKKEGKGFVGARFAANTNFFVSIL